jgi:hypothetical protein
MDIQVLPPPHHQLSKNYSMIQLSNFLTVATKAFTTDAEFGFRCGGEAKAIFVSDWGFFQFMK